MSERVELKVRYVLQVTVNDESAITRCTENEDGWRETYYSSLQTRGDVVQHFAWNAAVNRVEDASRLDGWGDLPRGAVTMMVVPEEEAEP